MRNLKSYFETQLSERYRKLKEEITIYILDNRRFWTCDILKFVQIKQLRFIRIVVETENSRILNLLYFEIRWTSRLETFLNNKSGTNREQVCISFEEFETVD